MPPPMPPMPPMPPPPPNLHPLRYCHAGLLGQLASAYSINRAVQLHFLILAGGDLRSRHSVQGIAPEGASGAHRRLSIPISVHRLAVRRIRVPGCTDSVP